MCRNINTIFDSHTIYAQTFIFFKILGEVQFTHVASTTKCIYNCPGMHLKPPPEVF